MTTKEEMMLHALEALVGPEPEDIAACRDLWQQMQERKNEPKEAAEMTDAEWQAEANAKIEALMKLIDEVCGFLDEPALYPLLIAVELLAGDPDDEERLQRIMCRRLGAMVEVYEGLSAPIIAQLQKSSASCAA